MLEATAALIWPFAPTGRDFILSAYWVIATSLSATQQLGQPCTVAPIGLNARGCTLWNQLRGNDPAGIALLHQAPVQPVTRRASLVGHPLGGRRPQLAGTLMPFGPGGRQTLRHRSRRRGCPSHLVSLLSGSNDTGPAW